MILTIAVIALFLLLADLPIVTGNTGLKKPKGRGQDMTGDAYKFIITTIVGRHMRAEEHAIDRSVIELFTHPIHFTKFNLTTAPVGGVLAPSLDLTKRYPEVVKRS